MWDGGYCDGGGFYDGGCYDGGFYDGGFYGGGYYDCYGPWYPPMIVPIGGFGYNRPYVREEIVHQLPPPQPQVIVINKDKKKRTEEEIEYMMVDPTDKEGKRLIKVDPNKVKEGNYVVDAPPVASKTSSTGPPQQQSTIIVQQQPAPQVRPIPSQTQRIQAPKTKKKKSSCRCC